ncbi:hypothetical protein LTS08_000516 [Lithohypha guttulata]|nr:hypothetical protein LTS08_000516 [Lithohypha guttulata]
MHDPSNQRVGNVQGRAMNVNGSHSQGQARHQPERVIKSPQWFSLPPAIRQLFSLFPLITYDENELPQRVPNSRHHHTLHIFTINGHELSPNPACLKWQAYLLAKRIPFTVVSANNHASPSGALPFLLPAQKSKKEPQPQAIPSSKIQRWAESQGAKEETLPIQLEAYMALIDQNVRNGWLYFLYLRKENFEAVARRLYVETASSNTMVQISLAHQLRSAAQEQLLRTRTHIDEEEIYEAADAAFKALATALGDDSFFSKTESPNIFDDSTLLDLLSRHEKLLHHRKRVLHFCNGDDMTQSTP